MNVQVYSPVNPAPGPLSARLFTGSPGLARGIRPVTLDSMLLSRLAIVGMGAIGLLIATTFVPNELMWPLAGLFVAAFFVDWRGHGQLKTSRMIGPVFFHGCDAGLDVEAADYFEPLAFTSRPTCHLGMLVFDVSRDNRARVSLRYSAKLNPL